MAVPMLKKEDVESIIFGCKVIGEPKVGGQKIVFPCLINGKTIAVKFILLREDITVNITDEKSEEIEEILNRATREIDIMNHIESPYLVPKGIIGSRDIIYNGQRLFYYDEEWIDGDDLKSVFKDPNNLDYKEVLNLCEDITKAIDALWQLKKIHRDIKIENIIRRKSNGRYVLLDLGIAFDLEDKSLTKFGFVVGTPQYYSPEQLDLYHRRSIDFRSDLFSLGVVMYVILTGKYPFYRNKCTFEEIAHNVIYAREVEPYKFNPNIPKKLSDLVTRLLKKQPSQRFNNIEKLLKVVESIREDMEV
ncbi:MAG: serine/threonine-protein kinase [Phascolarctobacterium sp.]|nr:serine/threonine-protein kinase [Phascolarctobacterium sp.]